MMKNRNQDYGEYLPILVVITVLLISFFLLHSGSQPQNYPAGKSIGIAGQLVESGAGLAPAIPGLAAPTEVAEIIPGPAEENALAPQEAAAEELSAFSSGATALTPIAIHKEFTQDRSDPLLINTLLYSLTLDADFELYGYDSIVRVILKSADNKEYLIYEANPLILDSMTFSVKNICEETCYLEGVSASQLEVQAQNAKVTVKGIHYSFRSISKNPVSIAQGAATDVLAAAAKSEQEDYKIQKIKEKLREEKSRWRAGKTSVSGLTYEQKKKLFGLKKPGQTMIIAPNTYGLEYYTGGVFEVKKEKPNPFQGVKSLKEFQQRLRDIHMKNKAPSGTLRPTAATATAAQSAPRAGSQAFPSQWDWRNRHGENWLTSIKDQMSCGSCWAFGATGATEAAANLYYNQHLDLDLSEQDAVSCSGAGSCAGGWPDQTLEYYTQSGVAPESCFPYTAQDIPCAEKCQDWQSKVVKIADHKVMPQRWDSFDYAAAENWLKENLIKMGPLSGLLWEWGHAMTLTGWETDSDGSPIWAYKNSWGQNWGERGYLRIKTDLINLVDSSAVYTPVMVTGKNPQVLCLDKDQDGFCNWGLGPKPESCPSDCQTEPDCDDSNPVLGPFTARYRCLRTDGGCTNDVKDGNETDLNCGGSCEPCENDKECLYNSDCLSNYCNPHTQRCSEWDPCNDGQQNGDETAVDCGGTKCKKCEDYNSCRVDKDCKSGFCENEEFKRCFPKVLSCTIWKYCLRSERTLIDIPIDFTQEDRYYLPNNDLHASKATSEVNEPDNIGHLCCMPRIIKDIPDPQSDPLMYIYVTNQLGNSYAHVSDEPIPNLAYKAVTISSKFNPIKCQTIKNSRGNCYDSCAAPIDEFGNQVFDTCTVAMSGHENAHPASCDYYTSSNMPLCRCCKLLTDEGITKPMSKKWQDTTLK